MARNQEVHEGDRKYMSERGSAGGRQEVQEGDRKYRRETGSGAYWKRLSEGIRSIPELDPAMGIWNK